MTRDVVVESQRVISHSVDPDKFAGQRGNDGEKGGDVRAFKLDVFLPCSLLNRPSCRPTQQVLPLLVPLFVQWSPRTEIETRTRP